MGYLTHMSPDVNMYKMNNPPTMVPPNQGPPSLLMPQSNIPLPMMLPSPQQGMHSSPGQQQHSPVKSENMSPKDFVSQMAQQHLANLPKSSPNSMVNGHMSPFFTQNGLNMSPPQAQEEDQPLSLVSQKIPRPLQEISNANITNEENHGAIDLTKKPSKSSSECNNIARNGALCSDRAECENCSHSLKLKMLRHNVVRMLSILVPNLNFEEKGISAEGDSVDELLHDVIQSNIQDEGMSD